MNEGMTGWLSPEGQFHPCGYGEHYDLASELVQEHVNKEEVKEKRKETFENTGRPITSERGLLELMTWIPMGVPKWGSQPSKDYLFINYKVGVTENQKKWFEENKDTLSVTQLQMVREALEDLDEMEELT